MQRYLIVIEPTDSGFSAYSPDVPGCVATARTQPDVERAMQDAIRFHLAGLREDGQPIPQANTSAAYVEVAA
jgi:predicted RNase H-like HicB family nuclease